uniref:Uncharacterized protein n=1 Tax=Candidatus Protofrankia californiensis TaxID=1839754 RepID=A0A1W1B819_9ACTN|nr:hypothetical protein FDG2_6002 [Candidatus Protofrankia californiensis]
MPHQVTRSRSIASSISPRVEAAFQKDQPLAAERGQQQGTGPSRTITEHRIPALKEVGEPHGRAVPGIRTRSWTSSPADINELPTRDADWPKSVRSWSFRVLGVPGGAGLATAGEGPWLHRAAATAQRERSLTPPRLSRRLVAHSSRAKKADAAFRISFARVSSRTSRSSSAIRCASAVEVPGRWPPSISACFTHMRRDSDPTPSRLATTVIAPVRWPDSLRTSKTIRTARSRSSAGYVLGVGTALILPRSRASTRPGAVQSAALARPGIVPGHDRGQVLVDAAVALGRRSVAK